MVYMAYMANALDSPVGAQHLTGQALASCSPPTVSS